MVVLQPDCIFNMHLECYYLKALRGSYILELRGFSEDGKFICGFTNKCFCVVDNDWNHVPIEGLG